MGVFVKSMRGQPLMPTTERKARILLKEGKAKIAGHMPFTIQLQYPTGEAVQPVDVGVDTDAAHGDCRDERNEGAFSDAGGPAAGCAQPS